VFVLNDGLILLHPQANRVVRLIESSKRKGTFVDDLGGLGSEITRELMVCPACACAIGKG
jgi:hypothetical protein